MKKNKLIEDNSKKEILNLGEFKENQIVEVVSTNGILPLKRRLAELGFVKGTKVRIINISPLKNSYLIELRGYVLALRKNAVNCVMCKKL